MLSSSSAGNLILKLSHKASNKAAAATVMDVAAHVRGDSHNSCKAQPRHTKQGFKKPDMAVATNNASIKDRRHVKTQGLSSKMAASACSVALLDSSHLALQWGSSEVHTSQPPLPALQKR
jgi:hypothetical protein